MLLTFTAGLFINLGNIAFWEDEGETIQYGKTILKYGYPSVFDGRSFILLDKNYHPQNYLRYTSPFLQFYVSAAAIVLFKNPANTFLMRLPFALSAIIGVWVGEGRVQLMRIPCLIKCAPIYWVHTITFSLEKL